MINRLTFVILLCLSFWASAKACTTFMEFQVRWNMLNSGEEFMYSIASFIIPFTILYCVSAWICQEKKGTVTP